MKALLLPLLFALVAGCASMGNLGVNEYLLEETTLVSIYENPVKYATTDTKSVGDSIGHFNIKSGDRLTTSLKVQHNFSLESWYLVTDPETGGSAYIRTSDATSLYELCALNTPNPMKVPADKIDLYWARANKYISEHSHLKIEISTDYLVRTYSPFSYGQQGYNVTRELQEDGSWLLTATGLTKSMRQSDTDILGRQLLLYCSTGKSISDLKKYGCDK